MTREKDLARGVGRGLQVVRGLRGQRSFADTQNVSQQTVSKYERGIMPAAFLRFLYNIHVREGVDLNRLVRGEYGNGDR